MPVAISRLSVTVGWHPVTVSQLFATVTQRSIAVAKESVATTLLPTTAITLAPVC